MTAVTQFGRPVQRPALPWEVTDIIIDYLHHDVRALGACGSVCSEWLSRSRHHLFSTVQLWPWRVRHFVELAGDKQCTFTTVIKRIEVDDLRERLSRSRKHWDGRSRSLSPIGRRTGIDVEREEETPIPFTEAMIYADMRCLAQVAEVQIRNVDWTRLRPTHRNSLRVQLAKFTQLRRLEFHDVVFQDLREVARIVNSFPSLDHLTAHVSFAQYLEHTLSAAPGTDLSTNVQSLELGTDDGIPVLLSCVEKAHRVREMTLKNIQKCHLQHIQRTMRGTPATHLQSLSLHFSHEKVSPIVSEDDLEAALDFSSLYDLRTLCIGGLLLTADAPAHQLVERTLPAILGHIEAAFLASVELQFYVEGASGAAENIGIEWGPLQRTLLGLHFFGMSAVHIQCTLGAESSLEEGAVAHRVRAEMADLEARGALVVRVVRMRRTERGGLVDDDSDDSRFGDKM